MHVPQALGDAFYDATLERVGRPWADRYPIASGLNEIWLGGHLCPPLLRIFSSVAPRLAVTASLLQCILEMAPPPRPSSDPPLLHPPKGIAPPLCTLTSPPPPPPGYRSTTVYTEEGPMLLIDRAASCMLAPLDLVRFLQNKLRVRELHFTQEGGQARLSGIAIDVINAKLTANLTRLKATSKHRTMEYTVRGLDTCRCDEACFKEVCGQCAKCADPTTSPKLSIEERCERPIDITVAQWFRREFPRVPLTRPDLPCVLVGPQVSSAPPPTPRAALSA